MCSNYFKSGPLMFFISVFAPYDARLVHMAACHARAFLVKKKAGGPKLLNLLHILQRRLLIWTKTFTPPASIKLDRREYISKNGPGRWRSVPKLAGLLRSWKSCQRRWTNYLRPGIKRGPFTPEEVKLVIQLRGILGNRWAAIAIQLPGRTGNAIKNLWNNHLKKRLDPLTHEPSASPATRHLAQWKSARLEAQARLSRESLLFSPPVPGKADSGSFLRIWNSEVGESFRKLNPEEKTACECPISQASSSTKCGSVSAITASDIGTNIAAGSCTAASNQNEDMGCKSCKSYIGDAMARSDSSSSTDFLQFLLDSPINNDMSFLEGNVDSYTTP